MASVSGSDELVTKTDLSTFYQGLLPYLGGMPEAVANKFSRSDIYSTTEKMIGTWTDGKPLYQRVYEGTMPTYSSGNPTEATIATGVTIDTVVNMEAIMYSSSAYTYLNLPCSTSTGYATVKCYKNSASSTYKNKIVLSNGMGSWSGYPVKVILQYTKTTDSATAIGVDTDYSTTEKIIGTWIDGKPIYQKTFQTTIPTVTSGNQTSSLIAVGAKVGTVINIIATALNPNGTALLIPTMYPDSATTVTKLMSCVKVGVRTNTYTTSADRNKINITNTNVVDLSGCTIYITIQYTKV